MRAALAVLLTVGVLSLRPCSSRGDVEQQLRALGLSSAVQAWIMSSLKTTAKGSEFAFDLDGKGTCTHSSPSPRLWRQALPRDEHAGAEQMFADYCSADLWHVVGAQRRAAPLSLLAVCVLRRLNLSPLTPLRKPPRALFCGVRSR